MHTVRPARAADAESIGRLLHDFNREFDDPTPGPEALAQRFRLLLADAGTVVLLGGTGPDGLAVLRFRPAIFSEALECYLAERGSRPARAYESLGFSNREGKPDGPLNFIYERKL